MSEPGRPSPSVIPRRIPSPARFIWLMPFGLLVLLAPELLAQLFAPPRLLGPVLGLADLILLIWIVLRYRPRSLVGPLFFYDLVRLARRGRSTLLRCTYALALLGVLCLAYSERLHGHNLWHQAFASGTRMSLQELARFSRAFVLALLIAQAGAVLAITPIYLAGAIAEERERRTLTLLFTTHLHDHEIVLGKLLSRLAHLGMVLLAGLPVFLAASLIGTGEMTLLVAGFVVTGLTLLSVGSLSILCSVLCRNVMTALLSSYVLLIAFNVFWIVGSVYYVSSPIAFLLVLNDQLGDPPPPVRASAVVAATPAVPGTTGEAVAMAAAYALIHGLLALLCIAVAIRRLRTAMPEPVLHPIAVHSRLVPISEAIAMPGEPEPVPVHASPSLSGLPPVSDHPLLWKELVHDPPAVIAPAREVIKRVGAAVLFGAAFVWALMLASWLLQRLDGQGLLALNYLLRGLGILLALVWCVSVAFRTASSISRERDRGTLGMLLTLPVDRDAILHAKWLGGILRLRTAGFLLAGVWTFGLLIGAFHPLAVLLLAGSCAIYVVFLASLGVWLSAASRNTMWAQLGMALILLAMFGGSWLYLLNQTVLLEFTSEPNDGIGHFYEVGLNPLAVWWVAGFSWPEWNEAVRQGDELFGARLRAIPCGLAIFGATAGLFWLAVRRRMRDALGSVDRLHGRSHS